MSLETYERTMATAEIYRKLMEAENELAQGRSVDGPTAFATLRAKYDKAISL